MRIAGNGFTPVTPERDAQGTTATEFMSMMFECEYCHECGRDADKHIAVIGPTGSWFAYCDVSESQHDVLTDETNKTGREA